MKKLVFLFLLLSFVGFSQNPVEQDSIYEVKEYKFEPFYFFKNLFSEKQDTVTSTFPSTSVGFSQDSLSVQRDTIYWTYKNEVGFDVSQVAFINWNIGGNNSISGLIKGRFERRYEKDMLSWNNDLTVRYGINKQDDREMRKTDDIFQFVSTVGYKIYKDSKFSYSSKFNFNTQFTNGYAYPNTDISISHAFAPAYMFLGVGVDYFGKRKEKNEEINFYVSPLTMKSTLVFNQRLADLGSFGVKKATYDEDGNRIQRGKLHRTEVGILLTNGWKKQLYENINFENRISLFTDYFNNFGNIDIDWQLQLEFIVNKYVKATMNAHIIYDDDVKAKKEVAGEMITVGPKVQIKQALGIGLVYTW